MMGMPSLKRGSKMFGGYRDGELLVKVGRERVDELIAAGRARRVRPLGRGPADEGLGARGRARRRLARARRRGARLRRVIVLLHGWPGDPEDWREVDPAARRGAGRPRAAVAPGRLRRHARATGSPSLIDEPAVVGGYDVGSRVAQALARAGPSRSARSCSAPPLPGAGDRVLTRRGAARVLVPGRSTGSSWPSSWSTASRDAVRAYLRHFWTHWSGPGFELADDHLERLADRYAKPGAFTASIGWYRAGSGMVAHEPGRDRRPSSASPAHDPGAVARARSPVPARVGRPPRRVLRRRHGHRPARRRPLLAARGARRLGG